MKKSLLVTCGLLLCSTLSATQTVTLDTSKTGEPISKYIYGQFIEHLGKCVNGGLWAEMLEDRKFYYPVTDRYNPWSVATDAFWNAGPYIYLSGSPWKVIGPRGAVTMDTQHTYVVDSNPDAGPQIGQVIKPPEAPVIHLRGDGTAAGISEENIQLTQFRDYTGYVILCGDASAAPVTVQMVLDDEAPRTIVTIDHLTADYQKSPFKFNFPVPSKNAHFEVISKGSGTFEIGTMSLMPADNINGWRADTVALLKELNSPIYRWPGGNFVSGYNWKDGIGADRDKRPPRKNPAWKGVEPNDVGIHEYMDLMKMIGAEPYLSVNTGLGTVAGVSEEVEYCNGSADTPMGKLRAANGHPEPYNVSWWAVGNEMFGNWQLGVMPMEQYVDKHNQVAAAMKSVDTKIKLVGVGDIGTKDWDATMLKIAGGNMTLMSEHQYVKEQFDVDAHVAELADQIKKVADAHRVLNKSIPEMAGKDVRVAMDEWNYWYGDYLYGELGVQYHLKDALGIAKGYHEFFRNSDIFYMANYAQTVNVIGAIKTTMTAATFDATGLPQVMYRQHFGTIPIVVPQQPQGLDVSAAWTDDHKAITIAVVNSHSTADELKLDLGATAVKADATQWIITDTAGRIHNPYSSNVPGQPPQVTLQQKSVTLTDNTLPVPAVCVVMYRLELR